MSDIGNSHRARLKYGISGTELFRAAELFDQAFAGKFSYAIPRADQRIKFWSEILNPNQIIGAYLNDELAGLAVLTFEDRPGFLKSAKKSLFNVLGPIRGLRAALYFAMFSKLDKKIRFPSAYLEAISVSENYRGMGIGKQLIDEAGMIIKKEGNTSLLLQVVIENQPAKKLYERIGFTVISTSSTSLLKLFAKVGGAHLMEMKV